jgi:HAE1 family hydrophobic/amphiphilic exporter-1
LNNEDREHRGERLVHVNALHALEADTAQVAQQLRPRLLSFPGFRAFVSLPPALQIGGRMGNSAYNLTVQSANTAELYDWASRLEAAITPLTEVQDVSDDMQMKSPRVNLVINRDEAAALGLSASDIETALYDGFGPQWASTIYGSGIKRRGVSEGRAPTSTPNSDWDRELN